MAQRVVDRLVEGYDDNPKIRNYSEIVKHGIKVKVLDRLRMDIKQELADKHLTVVIWNCLRCIQSSIHLQDLTGL